MDNLTMWSGIVAFFVPVATALIVQSKWDPKFKGVVFFVISMVAAAGTAWFQGELTGKRFLEAALVVVFGATVAYQTLWKPTTIAPAIEEATSGGGGSA